MYDDDSWRVDHVGAIIGGDHEGGIIKQEHGGGLMERGRVGESE